MEELSTELLLPSDLSYFPVLPNETAELQNNSENTYTNTTETWFFTNPNNFRHDVVWTTVLIVAYSLVFIVGTVGNILVPIVILLKPPMHPVTNMFLFNLAVADLLVIVFCVPATLLSNVLNQWIMGSFMCKGAAYVQGVAVCASAYSLAALSIDRWKAVCRPIERHQGQGITKFQALSSITLIWTFSVIITLPWAFVFQEKRTDGEVYCVEEWENEFLGKMYFVIAQLTCYFVIPFLLILSSNVVIWQNFSNRASPANSVSSHRKIRDGVKKTVGAVTAAFLISWVPLYVIVTLMKFSLADSIGGEWLKNSLEFLLPGAQWLGSFNSSLNPVLYAFLNVAFRKGFQSVLSSFMRHHN